MVKEFGYEYDAELNKYIWGKTKGKITEKTLSGAICLRSGRDALKAIAREYSPRTVLLPALTCDSMVFPFERYGHTVRYYKLNKDYSIDISSFIADKEQTIFLYMDYFGLQAISDEELQEMKKKGNFVFIEDRTHNLIWKRKSSFEPDYIMASLRKWIPVPDGGLLWGEISKPLASDTSFSSTRLQAQCMRHAYLQNGDESIKTAYRKIFSEVSDVMDKDEPSAMSAYSYALAKNTDWENVRAIRKENAKNLITILKTSPHITFIQEEAGLSDLYVAFTVKNRDVIQACLSKKGIFNTIIWPLNDEQRKICEIAKNSEKYMLAAPCDQRYTVEDMNYIGQEIVRVVNDVNR